MPNKLPNQYSLNLPGIDPQTARVFQDLADRVNYLTTEVDRIRGDIPTRVSVKAKKENPIPGILSIPCREDGGQDGFVRVNPDGVIVSYANPVESIFPYVDVSVVGNVTTGLDQLHSFTLPANTLANNGDALWVRYGGVFANNDNDKRIRTEFDGVATHDSGLFDVDSGSWMYDFLYTRVDPLTIKSPLIVHWNGGTRDGAGTAIGNYLFAGNFVGIAVSNLSTTNTVIRLMAEGTATDDIVQGYSFITLMKPRTVKLV